MLFCHIFIVSRIAIGRAWDPLGYAYAYTQCKIKSINYKEWWCGNADCFIH